MGHWVEVQGRAALEPLPDGWGQADLEALADAGLLVRVGEWCDPTDEHNKRITYEVAPAD
jgi:hypothetical protein